MTQEQFERAYFLVKSIEKIKRDIKCLEKEIRYLRKVLITGKCDKIMTSKLIEINEALVINSRLTIEEYQKEFEEL